MLLEVMKMAMSQEEILEIVITELMEKSLAELRDAERTNQPDLIPRG